MSQHHDAQQPQPWPTPEAIQEHLAQIGRMERNLTDSLRTMADQADALMANLMDFQKTLLVIQPAASVPASVMPEAAQSTVFLAEPCRPEPSAELSMEEKTIVHEEFIVAKPDSPHQSTSWLERELSQRGAMQAEGFPAAETVNAWSDGPSAIPPLADNDNETMAVVEAEPEDLAPCFPIAAETSASSQDAGLEEPDADIKSPNQETASLEFNLGIQWLSRIGIIAILVGLTMALCYTFPSFTREMKLLTGFILAGGFYFGGNKLYPGANVLGRILQGGGLALGYLSLFGIFFIPQVQLLDSSLLGYLLLFCYTCGTMLLSHRLKSQTTVILALAFGYYTAGYAGSASVALISTVFLMLGNAGLVKLHPQWQVASKVNLLGALWTYSTWCNRSDLMNQWPGMAYLGFVYLLFHVISVLRAGQGDALLNGLNTFACYVLFRSNNPAFAGSCLPEFIVGVVQCGSLVWTYRARPEQRDGALPYCLLITGLLFAGVGVERYFGANVKTTLLAGIALCLGVLGQRGVYRSVLQVASYLLLGLAGIALLGSFGPWMSHGDALWNGVAFIVCTFILEATAFREHPEPLRCVLLVLAGALYFGVITHAAPAEYRTLTYALSGFAWLASGLIWPRRMYRILGLCWIFLIGGFSLVTDFFYLETIYRILLFILVGVGLLTGSYGYVVLERRVLKAQSSAEEVLASLSEE